MERLDPSSSNDTPRRSLSVHSSNQAQDDMEEKSHSPKRRKSIFHRRFSSRCSRRKSSFRRESATSRESIRRKESAGTLVEAALDQAEARERHVRFGDHIAEAGNLVQQMLGTRIDNDTNHSTVEEYPECKSESIEDTFTRPVNSGKKVFEEKGKKQEQ
ncbi:hypothetical protein G6F56_009681 [Rhizopus delemar]|nr:hypothetical protein G6F56_009681 [Rhizopus delemar]